jgi:hypothetical protein
MTRKAIALDAYQRGHTARSAARVAGLSGSYVRQLISWAGVSRSVGRPRRAKAWVRA